MDESVRDILESLRPDQDALLRRLHHRITDDMLREIASADYGMDEDEHYEALVRARDLFDVADDWCPAEVLALIRWSEPDEPDWKPGTTGQRGHLLRLFACSALLYAAFANESFAFSDSRNETLIQLVDSAFTLKDGAESAARQFIAWLALEMPDTDEDYPFVAMGLLLLCAHAHGTLQFDAKPAVLAEWVLEVEQRHERSAKKEWLWGITFYDQKEHHWREWCRRLLLEPERPHPPTAADALHIIGRLAVGDAPT